MLHTCITPQGRFQVGRHLPSYTVANFRGDQQTGTLGKTDSGKSVDNVHNFPDADVVVSQALAVYEIWNPLPFRGCTYIDSGWADNAAKKPERIRMEPPPQVNLRALLGEYCSEENVRAIIGRLPLSLRYELAATSTDAQELVWLAKSCCRMEMDAQGEPTGLRYVDVHGQLRPDVDNAELFETIANNPHLPDRYKEVMVLRPGVQGKSAIVGDYMQGDTSVFEYLRANSYIPWGHYAANFAPQSIRYRIRDLSEADMHGLRHLYYQRVFQQLADRVGHGAEPRRRRLCEDELEDLRHAILADLTQENSLVRGQASLWGWNFGYDFSGSGYRLHASHQMIHQQYAMVPPEVATTDNDLMPAFCCGDLVAEVVDRYQAAYHSDFFADYLKAIASNTRTDQGEGESSLVVWEDAHVLLFVPKAQVSQWELQLMVRSDGPFGPVGNIVEADAAVRRSLNLSMLKAQQALAGLNAAMVTSIEFSKRLGVRNGQRLFYCFLPKLPWSMGGFSEAQGRYILGHYPEDFALACRRSLAGGLS